MFFLMFFFLLAGTSMLVVVVFVVVVVLAADTDVFVAAVAIRASVSPATDISIPIKLPIEHQQLVGCSLSR